MLIDEATKRPVARPQPDETLETALKRIRFTPTPKQPAQRPSAYFTETGAPEFKEGAPIVPRVLAIAETTSPAARRDRVRVTTRKSSKPRTIEFPKHWLIDLFSSSTVPSFAARSRKAIIPMDGDGNLPLQDITEEDWLLPNDLYTGLARKAAKPPAAARQPADADGAASATTRNETEPRTVPGVGRHARGTDPRWERGRRRHPVLVPGSDERGGGLPDGPAQHELPAARLHERQLRPSPVARGADPPLRRDQPAPPGDRRALHAGREGRRPNGGDRTRS